MLALLANLSGVVLVGLAALFSNPAAPAAQGVPFNPYSPAPASQTPARPAPAALAPAETADLTFMVEEEKMARDVYTTLYAKWGLPVFRNIAASEQQHMDAVRTVLSRYGVTDPSAGMAAGKFKNADLQALYNTLIAKGGESLQAALAAGALVEETDIADLREAKTRTSQADILRVYGNLERGSNNHLRAFTSLLAGYGVTYTPQVLSQADLDAIVTADMQTGNGNSRGGWRGGRP